jgi:hypothetical protein
MNLFPIGSFARLVAARARRRTTAEFERQTPCAGCCARVPEEVWDTLDSAYPDAMPEGPENRQQLAALFAPFMALHGWRFCSCYRANRPEHRFISRLVDTDRANAAAELLAAERGRR